MSFEVEFRNAGGRAASIGSAGPYTLVVDRPADAGGQGLGFNGGQLLYLAIGGCVSNDLFREANARGIRLNHVRVRVVGEFEGDPPVSADVSYDVEVAGEVGEPVQVCERDRTPVIGPAIGVAQRDRLEQRVARGRRRTPLAPTAPRNPGRCI